MLAVEQDEMCLIFRIAWRIAELAEKHTLCCCLCLEVPMKYNEHLKSLPTCDVVATGTTPNLELRICPHSQCVYECKKPVESNAKKRHHWRSDDAEKHLLRPHRMVQVTDLSLQRLFAHANIVLLSCLASTTRTMGAATRMEVAAKAYERRCDAPDVTIS